MSKIAPQSPIHRRRRLGRGMRASTSLSLRCPPIGPKRDVSRLHQILQACGGEVLGTSNGRRPSCKRARSARMAASA